MELILFITFMVITILAGVLLSIYSYKFDRLRDDIEEIKRYTRILTKSYVTMSDTAITIPKDTIKECRTEYESKCPVCGHLIWSKDVESVCSNCGCKLNWNEVFHL